MTVLKCAGVAYLSFWGMALVAGTVLWNVARVVGVLASVQRLLAQLTSSPTFRLDGAKILVASSLGAVVLALVGAALTGLAVVVSNLTANIVGGIDVEVDDQAPRSRRATRPSAGGARA